MSKSRSKCMQEGCEAPPEHECIWAGARARAWYCAQHYEPWKKDMGRWLELVKERKVKGGVVGIKYGEKPSKEATTRSVLMRWAGQREHFEAGVRMNPVRTPQKRIGSEDTSMTGDGSKVFLSFVLPEALASQFPKSDLPPHVTFLYVGVIEEGRLNDLEQVLKKVLSEVPSVKAALGEVDYFINPEGRVAFNLVRFDRDVSKLRDQVWDALSDEGFDVADSHPNYRPHATIAYIQDQVWKGQVPKGSWTINSIQISGIPQVRSIPFGSSARMARIMQKRARTARLQARWRSSVSSRGRHPGKSVS